MDVAADVVVDAGGRGVPWFGLVVAADVVVDAGDRGLDGWWPRTSSSTRVCTTRRLVVVGANGVVDADGRDMRWWWPRASSTTRLGDVAC